MSGALVDSTERTTMAIPATFNLGLAAGYALVHGYQFIVLPAWLLGVHPIWAWTLVPLALLTNPCWSLVHESIHELLHPNRRINAAVGRVLSILFGSPFRILRSSHLLHHKLNRAPIEGTEYYERGKDAFSSACLGYYFQILGGLYAVEVISPLVFFLPRRALRRLQQRFVKSPSVSGILVQSWAQDEAIREIRIDGVLTWSWFGIAVFCYWNHLPWLIFAISARAFLISFLDNVYHYRTPVNDLFFAHNLRLPGPVEKALLYFNLHGVHHQNPAIPWSALDRAFRGQAQSFHGDYFSTALRQLAGPVALQDLLWADRRRP